MAEKRKSDSKKPEKNQSASGKKKKTSLYQSEVRMPPHNIEAEISTLGALMIDKNAITKIADIVQPEDFYKEKHEKIFKAAQELYQDQDSLDILSISAKLKEKKQLKDIGGRTY